jgi:NADH dehydrogenase [ubiquinone] 1 alpha subcomplex assembly factor 5
MEIFDRSQLKAHLARAEKLPQDPFIWQHCAAALQDRLLDIKRGFDTVIEVSPQALVLTPEFLQRKQVAQVAYGAPLQSVDDEFWPFATHALDGIVSLGHLHWVNDLPGTLIQFKNSLRPDGLFLSAFIGGESLRELRASIAQVEMEIYDGISPRVSPFVTLPDMAALMQRAHFALPVVDNEMLTVTYGSLEKMISDLRSMGQSNAIMKRDRKILRRDFWPRVEDYYRRNFADKNGRLMVTIEIIYALGWAPADSQPQPLKRGSATHQLVDVLKQHEK